DPESALPNIRGSIVHLSKVVMNLIINAAEAMPDGGVVRISTESRREARPAPDNAAAQVILTISDTGSGISPEDQERIFEPFYTKKKMGRSGAGLGMAVVWGAVQDHDGSIEVKSREGEGATFIIRFPAVNQEVQEGGAVLSMDRYMGKGEVILIVDDVKEQREIATDILTTLGYSTISVSSGEEAVAYMEDHTADLVLLDMIMDPGIDGLTAYKKILERRPGQKAI
ncbi:MAG: response regulator, partial [Desulfobacterales bacterium]|nr:response regulator [Desulfobacterales bacterium]